MSALVATGLGKRYGKKWALRDCSLEIPEGRIAALVGPNGAGKTTLLHLATALLEPTTGSVSVLGRAVDTDRSLLADIGFVAQDVPLYRSFSVGDMLEFGRRLNARWNDQLARSRLESFGIAIDEKVGNLSGGQRAQVALALALAKQPRILLLDEPLASLDPLARREFLGFLMESVAERQISVVLSSHLVQDLERVCDYLIVLSAARTQVVGDIAELLDAHKILVGPRTEGKTTAGVAGIVNENHTERQTTMLVRTDGPIIDPAWTVESIGLEELVLAYLGKPNASALPGARLEVARGEASR